MIFKNNFLLLSIFVFSALSSTQEIDQDLLSQLSLDEIEVAREILESQNMAVPENLDLPDLEELPAPGAAQIEVCGLIKNAQC